jgi:DNA repair protein RadD
MRVEYRVGLNEYVSEWVCFEHHGYPRAKAEEWWRRRSHDLVPQTAEEAVARAECGALAPTLRITVARTEGEKHDRIVGHVLGAILEPGAAVGAGHDGDSSDDDVPF